MINETTTVVNLSLQSTSVVQLSPSEIINYIWNDLISSWDNTLSMWDMLELQNTPTSIQITNITI
jgi:hypothetical protein